MCTSSVNDLQDERGVVIKENLFRLVNFSFILAAVSFFLRIWEVKIFADYGRALVRVWAKAKYACLCGWHKIELKKMCGGENKNTEG